MPHRTRVFLDELKALAFLEFIPYEWLTGGEKAEQSQYAEKIGIDRYGSNSLVDGMGSMLIIAITIGVIILLLLVLKLLTARFQFIKKVYTAIKSKIVYNTLLRYIM